MVSLISNTQELVLYPQSRELPIENRNIDSLSEGVIHLIKSKTFCSKKAFLGNKSNCEVRSSVEIVKTRTLWK